MDTTQRLPPPATGPAPPSDVITRRVVLGGLAALAAVPVTASCRSPADEENSVPTPLRASSPVDLPAPTEGTVPLEVVLRRRRSVREFAPDALEPSEIGQLLWAAQGLTAEWGGRTAPSAGARYPLELHAVTATGTMRYLPEGHRVELTTERDLRPDLMAAAGDQEPVGRAPLVVDVTAVPARTAARYGERAPRYVDLEAGHAAQNLLLQAVAIDLAAVPIGAFDDEAVRTILGLPGDQTPRYLLPVGRPLP